MAIPKVTGAVEIFADGSLLLNKEGANATGIGLSGEPNFEIEPVMGDTGHHGFKEKPILSQLEVKVTDRNDVMIDTLARIGTAEQESTIIFRARGGTGKSWTLKNPVCTRNISLVAGEGETTVKFIGDYWTERAT